MDTKGFLRNVELFRYLDDGALEHLADQVELISLPQGPIIRSSDDSDGLYIIKSGAAVVTVTAATGAAETTLATFREGKSFGEIGLIDGLPRSANVTAMEPMECFFLARDAFLATLDENPELAKSLVFALASMVRNANQVVGRLLLI